MERRARGATCVLLAALALAACSKPQGAPAGPGSPAIAGGATSGAAQSGIGLKGGMGTGLTGSFPSTPGASQANQASTGSMGNTGQP